jgi:hypothetical protein
VVRLHGRYVRKEKRMDKTLAMKAAEKIRARLEKRLANFLGSDAVDLPRLKLGELLHLSFAIWGEEETIGGFHATFSAVSQLVGREIMWDLEPKIEEMEKPKAAVVN